MSTEHATTTNTSGPPATISPQHSSEAAPVAPPTTNTTTAGTAPVDSTQAPQSPGSQGSQGEGNLEQVLHLEPDTGDNSDNDSAFDANSSASTSLASSILNYEYFNGRRYHGFRQGSYVLPNDEQEQDRLDLLHHIFLLILGGKLYDAPIPPAPRRVLDIGTGTGIWAIDFADENPGAEVIGTDLSPIQPTWVPPNVKFYIDDAEAEWVYSADEKFDFIHCRTMAGSIGDWDRFVAQCYTHLQPGGYLELQEPLALCESDDGTLAQAENMCTWQTMADEAAKVIQKDIRVGTKLKQKMIDQGFVDVHEKTVKVPIGPWPKDPKMKEVGRYQREHMAMGIEPYTLGLAGKVLGWSEAECRVLIAKVVSDVRNRAYHMYIRFVFVYGRKPEASVH